MMNSRTPDKQREEQDLAPDDDILFGNLIAEVGWVSAEQLDEAVAVSEEVSVPLGRVLLMRGLLTEQELTAAIEVQSLLRDGLVDRKSGARALSLVSWASLSLDNAFAAVGIDITKLPRPRNRLGTLLVSARYVTKDRVDSALTLSVATGLPLGKALVLKGVTTRYQVETALWAQKLIRNERVTRGSAVDAMREISLRSSKLTACDTTPLDLEFAEILILTGIVDQHVVVDALDVARINNQALPDVMVLFALISSEISTAATILCKRMREGTVTLSQAARALSVMQTTGATLKEAMNAADAMRENSAQQNLTTINFLKMVGCLRDSDLQRVIDIALSDAEIMKLIMKTELLDEETLRIATRLKFLVKQGSISLEQAELVFNRWQASGQASSGNVQAASGSIARSSRRFA